MLVEMSRSEMLKDIAVIVVSGMDQEGHVLRAVQSGALDYLPKPVNSRSIERAFQKFNGALSAAHESRLSGSSVALAGSMVDRNRTSGFRCVAICERYGIWLLPPTYASASCRESEICV